MRKSFLAIPLFSLGLMATSALALDIGAGKGGVDVDLNVGGKDGSAIGVDVQVGGGGVSVGADVNAGGAGGGKSGGGTGSAGGSGGQAGAGSGANANGVSSPSSSGAAAPANSSSAVSPATASAVDAPRVVQLPLYLLPTRDSGPDHTPPGSGAQVESTGSVRLDPMVSRPGIPASVLGACREAIASAASPYGAARVEVVSAGRSTRMRGGGVAAPVEARILYSRNGRLQVRQAQVSCRLNASGNVVAAL